MSPAPANGNTLRIRRVTPNTDTLVNFTQGAVVNEPNLDKVVRQAVMAAADASDTGQIAAATLRHELTAFRIWTPAAFSDWIKDSLVTVLPATFKGDKGDKGDASTVPGPIGPAPSLTIGNVTNVATGGTATAALRPNGTGAYFLDLGLPIGATGSGASVSWGGILGTLANQTDLVNALAAKADSGHTHTFASITAKPTTLAGYGITDAATGAHTHTFASITSKPTTLAGYGITDAAAVGHSHSFSEVTGKPTTLAGYGITDALGSAFAAVPKSRDASDHTGLTNSDNGRYIKLIGSTAGRLMLIDTQANQPIGGGSAVIVVRNASTQDWTFTIQAGVTVRRQGESATIATGTLVIKPHQVAVFTQWEANDWTVAGLA